MLDVGDATLAVATVAGQTAASVLFGAVLHGLNRALQACWAAKTAQWAADVAADAEADAADDNDEVTEDVGAKAEGRHCEVMGHVPDNESQV